MLTKLLIAVNKLFKVVLTIRAGIIRNKSCGKFLRNEQKRRCLQTRNLNLIFNTSVYTPVLTVIVKS